MIFSFWLDNSIKNVSNYKILKPGAFLYMKILSTNIYVGPNLYANFPVIRHVIDLGVLENWPSAKIGEAFIDGLVQALPGLEEHGCSYREKGGFVRRLREGEGTWMGHIWEHVTLEIQSLAGIDVGFGRTRSTGEPAQYSMVYEYKQRDVGLEAAGLARDLLISLLPKEIQNEVDTKVVEGFNFAEEAVDFIRFAQSKEFGPSTGALVKAAEERNIPWLRLNEHSLVQFGHGKYQKRIQATITSETKHISVEIACNKKMTNKLLGDIGLPVPKHITVRRERQVVSAARKLGYPVVVKPLDGNHGRGISINLNSDEEVLQGYAEAKEHSSTVIIEQFITGYDHRMVVVDGKLVAVAKRVPGHVVGDGKSNIEELVDIVNDDPRRGVGHEKVLTRLEFDDQANRLLHEAGYNKDTILKSGEVFYLRTTANLSTGGTAIDVTDICHPDNRDMAERAVKAIGLDVGGVDFLIDDITHSYKEIGGGICEVNAAPGFRMHVAPSEGHPRDVAGAVMDMLFPESTPRRIPIASITGTNGKTTTSRMVSHVLKSVGKTVGLTTTDGIYVNDKLTVAGDTTGPQSAQMSLRDPTIDVAVFETARGGLLRSGMGYDYCNVGACLNVTSDHLGLKGVNTLEDLAKIKRIVVEAARDTAVLNADDPHCLQMAAYTDAENIFYVTMNPEHTLVKEHIRKGGKAAIVEKGINGDMITIFDNHMHMPVLWTHLIPATMEGKAIHNVQNAMFAVAITYSLGLHLDEIRSGLRTFNTSFFQAPGRMNLFEEHDFKVLMDYAHNPAAIEMIGKLVTQLEVKGKRTCVIAAPGDRRDEDIRDAAIAAAPHFDHFICRQDDGRRGRKDGEVTAILKKGLTDSGVDPKNIEVITSEVASVDHALKTASAGDMVVIFADDIKRTWKQIIYFNKDKNEIDASEKGDSQKNSAAQTSNEPEKVNISKGPNMSKALQDILKGDIISDARGVRVARVIDEDAD